MGRLLMIATLAIATFFPSAAHAATELGTTDGAPGACGGASGVNLVQATAGVSTPPYTAAASGVITSWSHLAGGDNGQLLRVLVLRPTGTPDQYTVVAVGPTETPTPSVRNTFTLSPALPMQAGDLIGLRESAGPAGTRCVNVGQPGDQGKFAFANTEPTAGDQVTIAGVVGGGDSRVNVAASLEADNDNDLLGDETQDSDDDNDGVADTADNCQLTANADQANADGDAQGNACEADDDADGLADGSDNCPVTANADQVDNDGDLQGDACDADDDNDSVADTADNCVLTANLDQEDRDKDGIGHACDDSDFASGGCANPIDGTAAADRINGSAFGDHFQGFGGGDHLFGLDGIDCLEGGEGNDVLYGNQAGDWLWGGDGNDGLHGRAGDDNLRGEEGDDYLAGREGADSLKGGPGNDRLRAREGDDYVSGGAGDDQLVGGDGTNRYRGGEGDDRINARNGVAETVSCGAGDDVAIVDAGDTTRGCNTIRRD